MTQRERLLQLLYEMHYGQTRFEDEIGASRGCIAHMSDFVSQNFLRKVAARFPDVNTNWIITGVGEMFTSSEQPEDIDQGQRTLLNEIAAQRTTMEKCLAQIDRLNETIAECQRSISALSAKL